MDPSPIWGAFDTIMKIVSWNATGEEYGLWNLVVDVSAYFG